MHPPDSFAHRHFGAPADHAAMLAELGFSSLDALVDAAVASGAEAVHPGYGFLSERATFAQAVEEAGLVFIGPPPAVIAALGDKLAARRIARAADVPHVPGTLEAIPGDRPDQLEAVISAAAGIGFPLLVKARHGFGSRDIYLAADRRELEFFLGYTKAASMTAFCSRSSCRKYP